MTKPSISLKSLSDGFLASAGLASFYFLVLRLGNGSWDRAVGQFLSIWPWIILLDLSFGLQIGLYSFLRQKVKDAASARMAASATGASTVGMVACCAHHIGDILPLVGLSGVFLFLTKYQAWFIGLGLLSNLISTFYIMRSIRQVRRIDGRSIMEPLKIAKAGV
ncbi:MAG: hypothetical protein Q8P89_05070 [bacterium]|nr:hypothetical protein [bacterium]